MRVIQISSPFNDLESDYKKITTTTEYKKLNLLDADLLVIGSKNRFVSESTYGFDRINPLSEETINDIIDHNRLEIDNFLRAGKTIVLFLEGDFSVFLDGDVADTPSAKPHILESATRIRRSLIPNFNHIIKKELNGLNVHIDDTFEDVIYLEESEYGTSIHYSYELNRNNIDLALMTIKNSNVVVGGVKSVLNGKILVLPSISFDYSEIPIDRLNYLTYKLVTSIYEYSNKIKFKPSASKYIMPDWLKSIKILDELHLEEKIEVASREIKKQQRLQEDYRSKLETIISYKRILSSSGDVLEKDIASIFKRIGFNVITSESNNRVDLILQYDDEFIVCEIKGVSKSSAEKHAAQLEKWSSEFYLERNINPKGLLIVCPYKDLPLSQRKEKPFPDQMLKYINLKGQACMTTEKLLEIFVEFLENRISKPNLWALLYNKIGEI